MDTASESIHSLLPVFMAATLGASMTVVGITEGLAEGAALIVRVFSGVASDYFGRHKKLTMVGYGLAALSKFIFPLAYTIELVFAARFIDRVGKGIRGAPRDALIGEIAPAHIRGACFGLRQSMDTIGAVLGPLLAMAGLYIFADNIRTVLWLAIIPAAISFLILWWGVHEPERQQRQLKAARLRLIDFVSFRRAYWWVVIVGGVLSLARYSEAFIVMKAYKTGLPISLVPLVLIFMNIVFSASAYPAGILSDRCGRKTALIIGIACLIGANVLFAGADSQVKLSIAIALFGFYLGFTQGLFSALITDLIPAHVRGTAFGVFNLTSGLAMLIASIGGGMIWDHWGSSKMFSISAGVASLALLLLLLMRTTHEPTTSKQA